MLVGRAQTGKVAEAGYTLDSSALSATDAGFPSADAELIFYQVGDASGRGGEVWELTQNFGDSKLGDWVAPNDASGDFYVQFSSLTGDTPSGWTTSWIKIGGSGSSNKSLSLSANYYGDDRDQSFFSVALGTDGSSAEVGPTSGWEIEADAS